MSDLVTRYGLQATRFACLVLVPFEHEPSKSMSVNNEKKLRKNNRNICVTCISNPANEAKITSETYN